MHDGGGAVRLRGVAMPPYDELASPLPVPGWKKVRSSKISHKLIDKKSRPLSDSLSVLI